MKIRWNGHSSFTIIASNGTVIITDPYEPGGFGGALKYGAIEDKADIVTVSHEHGDHNHISGLSGSPQVIRESGTAKGISFKAVPAYHDDSKGSSRGVNNIIVFSVDGVRLCHLGDIGHQLTPDTIGTIGEVDVLFLPIGGYFTVDPNQAAQLMKALNAKIIVPMHFKTEKCGFPIAKLDDFLHGKEEMVKTLGTSEIEVSKKAIPAKNEIWIFEHAC